jgi:hypothetical protein
LGGEDGFPPATRHERTAEKRVEMPQNGHYSDNMLETVDETDPDAGAF